MDQFFSPFTHRKGGGSRKMTWWQGGGGGSGCPPKVMKSFMNNPLVKVAFSSLSVWALPVPETEIKDHFSIERYSLLVGNMASENTFDQWKVFSHEENEKKNPYFWGEVPLILRLTFLELCCKIRKSGFCLFLPPSSYLRSALDNSTCCGEAPQVRIVSRKPSEASFKFV